MAENAIVRWKGRYYLFASYYVEPKYMLRRLRTMVRKRPKSFAREMARRYSDYRGKIHAIPATHAKADAFNAYFYDIKGNTITVYESVPVSPNDYKHWKWKKIRTVVVQPLRRRKPRRR